MLYCKHVRVTCLKTFAYLLT